MSRACSFFLWVADSCARKLDRIEPACQATDSSCACAAMISITGGYVSSKKIGAAEAAPRVSRNAANATPRGSDGQTTMPRAPHMIYGRPKKKPAFAPASLLRWTLAVRVLIANAAYARALAPALAATTAIHKTESHSERKKLTTACWSLRLRMLKFRITLFASEPSLACCWMAW